MARLPSSGQISFYDIAINGGVASLSSGQNVQMQTFFSLYNNSTWNNGPISINEFWNDCACREYSVSNSDDGTVNEIAQFEYIGCEANAPTHYGSLYPGNSTSVNAIRYSVQGTYNGYLINQTEYGEQC